MRFGDARRGVVGQARQSKARYGRRGNVRLGLSWLGGFWPVSTRQARLGEVLLGLARCGGLWRDLAGEVRYGEVGQGEARRGGAWHGRYGTQFNSKEVR